ncbi:low affinity immunoglobulin gamma Fc region receptor II-like isoform X2 [Gadus macrocephalus]|uniref:low affinity immunoglobulin gamma Fc region receptor II-like isoform X2 n=1 Tax=Gadus macrocephalus TaxID=80720 RepID=UPI0028CB2FA8|nr:low affinity immunoglobulin gamma Fc region receptor II-like isoform X2 [Gadus macrocephalus]
MEFPLRTMLLLSLGPLLAREIVQGKDIKMYQTADLEVVEGDSVTLHCCWTAVNHTHYRAGWSKNEVTILHQLTALTNDGEGCGLALSPVNNGTCGCATLTLPNVNHNHTGCYICKASIDKPMLIQFRGNGTMITVRERRSPTNGTTQENTPLRHLVTVVVSLAIAMAAVFLVTLIYLWKLQRRRGLDRAARVIYEVPHRDSEVDGTSTSSSKGSSQWCQVPVYESFDYFEHGMESKGSG